MTNPQNYQNPPSAEAPQGELIDPRRKEASLAVFLVGHIMALLSFAMIIVFHLAISEQYFAMKEKASQYFGDISLDVPSWTITFLVLIPVLVLPFGIVSTYLLKRAQRINRCLSSAFLMIAAASSIAAAAKIEPLFFSLVTVIILIVAVLEWVGPLANYFPGRNVDLSRVKKFVDDQRAARAQKAAANFPPQPNGNYQYNYPPQPQAPNYPQAPQGYQQPNPYGAPLQNPYAAHQQSQQPPHAQQPPQPRGNQPWDTQQWETQQWDSPSEPPADESSD